MPTMTVLTYRGFNATERVAIKRAAKAMSPAWGTFHFRAERYAETVSVGPLAGGNLEWGTQDAFGLQAQGRGRVELQDLQNYGHYEVFETLEDALKAMTGPWLAWQRSPGKRPSRQRQRA